MSSAEQRAQFHADLKARITAEVERLAREYDTTPAEIVAFAQAVLRGEAPKPVSDRMNVGEG